MVTQLSIQIGIYNGFSFPLKVLLLRKVNLIWILEFNGPTKSGSMIYLAKHVSWVLLKHAISVCLNRANISWLMGENINKSISGNIMGGLWSNWPVSISRIHQLYPSPICNGKLLKGSRALNWYSLEYIKYHVGLIDINHPTTIFFIAWRQGISYVLIIYIKGLPCSKKYILDTRKQNTLNIHSEILLSPYTS